MKCVGSRSLFLVQLITIGNNVQFDYSFVEFCIILSLVCVSESVEM